MNPAIALGPKKQYSVLGLPVDCTEDYVNYLLSRLEQRLGTHVVTLNAEMAMQAEGDPNLARIIQQAELVVPDGSGIILYLRLKGVSQKRCPGIELAESLLVKAANLDDNNSIFFYGGKPGVAMAAGGSLQEKIGGLEIASQHGYLAPEEEKELLQTLKDLQPRIILVGLGVPRQEFWIAENRHICPEALWIGVGGCFDIWAGMKKRAPAWFCDNHLEWLYRLYQEPWRWRRMLALPKFAIKAVMANIN
ncbi:MAG: WecB/TagA/CpsF family glycosyltransferase [Cyanobacteriota bacterium]|nr:WecB/TagA/CpsF family glycosyltransferase [Cyanobacteriota bacterium]